MPTSKRFPSSIREPPLNIYQHLEDTEHVEPLFATIIRNLSRLRRLEIISCLDDFDHLSERLSGSAPVLEHLWVANFTDYEVKFPRAILGGQLPKLSSLTLWLFRTVLRGSNFPSLTRFNFMTGAKISVLNLTLFFKRCPLLEFIQIRLDPSMGCGL